MIAALYKKEENEEEIVDLVEINLWEITESKRNTVDNTFYKTEDSYLTHVRVYSSQSIKQNQWLNSEVIDVKSDYVAATVDTVSFSHMMKQESSESLFESQIRQISLDANKIIIPVIHCSHWFSMIFYLKEKFVTCLDYFYKTRKAGMFEKVFLFIINGSSRNQ